MVGSGAGLVDVQLLAYISPVAALAQTALVEVDMLWNEKSTTSPLNPDVCEKLGV